MRMITFLEQQPKPVLVVLGCVLWLVLGVSDYYITHRLLLEFSSSSSSRYHSLPGLSAAMLDS